jgi:hypothetical protein
VCCVCLCCCLCLCGTGWCTTLVLGVCTGCMVLLVSVVLRFLRFFCKFVLLVSSLFWVRSEPASCLIHAVTSQQRALSRAEGKGQVKSLGHPDPTQSPLGLCFPCCSCPSGLPHCWFVCVFFVLFIFFVCCAVNIEQ